MSKQHVQANLGLLYNSTERGSPTFAKPRATFWSSNKTSSLMIVGMLDSHSCAHYLPLVYYYIDRKTVATADEIEMRNRKKEMKNR